MGGSETIAPTVPGGLSYPAVAITQHGSAGSTFYIYNFVCFDSGGGTRAVGQITGEGNATLTGSNYNIVTIAAFTSSATYSAPSGNCDVYRVVGGATQGKIGTLTPSTSTSVASSHATKRRPC